MVVFAVVVVVVAVIIVVIVVVIVVIIIVVIVIDLIIAVVDVERDRHINKQTEMETDKQAVQPLISMKSGFPSRTRAA